ncbi:MAG: polyphosphate polymerase domain-containing protein [Bacteroidales bacterium]|nr:polyphosphate polymerase domain-containing protein [Bacteroidales bacterium]MDE6256380.1 polyphosphate polymerase domain-containing protein [Muribaculaceae bacterium]
MIDLAIIDSFKTISLKDMGKVKLMNRIDTKYVTTLDKIIELLKILSGNYLIQQIEGRSNMPYYTKYFDTPDVQMFYQHQRGKMNRQKVRIRLYEDCNTPPFIEIKTKSNKGRTKKKRVAMEPGSELFHYDNFFNLFSQYDPVSLIPQIENHFYRITLINKEMTERITIDTNLEFHNFITDKALSLDNIGIIEWKRDGHNGKSGFEDILRSLKIQPSGFSKYCIGMAVTNPELRQNRLKPKLRMIKRLASTSRKDVNTDNL